jgi:preprotein translocase subunit Sss1
VIGPDRETWAVVGVTVAVLVGAGLVVGGVVGWLVRGWTG